MTNACFVVTILCSVFFAPSTSFLTIKHVSRQQLSRPVRLRAETTGDSTEQVLQSRKEKLSRIVKVMDDLADTIESSITESEFETIEKAIEDLEDQIASVAKGLVPPSGMSLSTYKHAIIVFARLPYVSRLAFCEALNLEDPVDTALDFNRIPEIVSLLYVQREQLTPAKMRLAMVIAKEKRFVPPKSLKKRVKSLDLAPGGQTDSKGSGISLFDEQEVKDGPADPLLESLISRTTRQEGRTATKEDLNTLMSILGKNNFECTGTDEVPGGWVIRGRNVKDSSAELIEDLDSRTPAGWSAQVSFVPDISSSGVTGKESGDPILLLLKKDMSPQNRKWLLSFTSAAAIFTAFLFVLGTYGSNEVALARITNGSDLGDYSGLTWFNSRVGESLLSLAAIQAVHELGHLGFALRHDLKTSPPTFLPLIGLPFCGAKTSLKESPKNLTALFDFAFTGPFLGILASLAFLFAGLQLTAVADADTAQYFPSLPVDLIRSSALGATIVDSFFSGTIGISGGSIIPQDPNMGMAMHPFAIAGFVSLMINSLELLPLGSTDGGRLGLAIFGRRDCNILGFITWISLLVAGVTASQPLYADMLVSVWILNNFAQKDQEIPCRDEVEQVDWVRTCLALGLWSVAFTAIVPL